MELKFFSPYESGVVFREAVGNDMGASDRVNVPTAQLPAHALIQILFKKKCHGYIKCFLLLNECVHLYSILILFLPEENGQQLKPFLNRYSAAITFSVAITTS
jgi:hypothetical protein